MLTTMTSAMFYKATNLIKITIEDFTVAVLGPVLLRNFIFYWNCCAQRLIRTLVYLRVALTRYCVPVLQVQLALFSGVCSQHSRDPRVLPSPVEMVPNCSRFRDGHSQHSSKFSFHAMTVTVHVKACWPGVNLV